MTKATKAARQAVVGRWRIVEMEAWDADDVDMEIEAHITIRADMTGEFQFGLVQGGLDARLSMTDGTTRVDFSWSGFDESDPISGRGWMHVTGDQAKGRFFIHLGDDSAFTAVR
jgi:hypothetical protein